MTRIWPGQQPQPRRHWRLHSVLHPGRHSRAPGTDVPLLSTEAKLDAVIRTCEGFRYGLEFTRVSDAMQEMIVKNCNGTELLQ